MRFTPDQKAAHALLTELRTRITTQPLPYQHGKEDCALESLHAIFGLTRKAINDNPGCQTFAQKATEILNIVIRPVTAKWHSASEEGWLNTRDGGDEFRGDLLRVQTALRQFAEDLQVMAYGSKVTEPLVKGPMEVRGNPPVNPMAELEAPLTFGIPAEDAKVWKRVGNEVGSAEEKADLLNKEERKEVLSRRAKKASGDTDKTEPKDAIGLAFSGGGIRSATFCLGVTQALAEKDLLRDVDFLSTVSGGGYTGSFLTQRIGGTGEWSEVARPHGPDTDAIRRLRLNAKFISAGSAWDAWRMAVTTLAGMFMNWMVPLAILVLMAVLTVSFNLRQWLQVALPLAGIGISVLFTWLFFGTLRWRLKELANLLGWGIALFTLLTVLTLLAFAGHGLYQLLFPNAGKNFADLNALWISLSASPLWKAMGLSGLTLGGLASLVPTATRYFRILKDPANRKWVLIGALVVAALFVPLLGVCVFLLLVGLAKVQLIGLLGGITGIELLIGVLGSLVIITMFALNLNQTGPHRLYRDGLSKTFVEIPANRTDDTPLSGINPNDLAPYHLINTAVNLPSSRAEALRERKCDFFLFSKHWSGSPAVGYFKTSNWKTNGSVMDLATAMAISGAAFSANMGLGSIAPLRALLAFLNVRLGYWIRRPDAGGPERLVKHFSPGFTSLLREMTAQMMDEGRPWYNLSDGGHVENLGVYELLRRRCKFIICVDGEADPEFTFQGLMTVVRHAQIDLGVRINPDLDDIRQDAKTTYSRSHYHLCRIHYPARGADCPAGTGLLLYLKLSVTSNESELIRRYRGNHPEFPHQTTLDQFFDEEQFEAYRQLGVHVAEGMFQACLMGESNVPSGGYRPTSMRDWFIRLAKNLLV